MGSLGEVLGEANVQSGIYHVNGDTCPTQIVVSKELSDEDNLWLNCLRNDLAIANLERLSKAKESELPMDAYVYVRLYSYSGLVATSSSTSERSSAFPRRRTLCTN